ncbi:tape measure protein [Sphingomonas sp.]|uniref:tape measure protein n=1 Tax=Sphingomonas sp. TaxID=28214 RepID=UPI0031D4FC69
MSVDIATLGIKVDSSDVRGATGELRILVEVGTKAERATDGLKNSFGGLKTAIAGLGLGALLREAGQLADTYSNIRGRLSLVTNGTADLANVTQKLFDSAQRARVSFEATTDLYSSLARSTKALGTSQTDLLAVTETINKALIVSGASAATAEGALTQLGQGFASGTLRGDELNSVLEGTPRLAQAIADGMGVTVGQLRKLGGEGKITGETVFNALKGQKDAVEAEFAKMPATIGQSFVQLRNEILKYVGEADTAGGTSAAFAEGVQLLAHNLDIVVPVIGVVGLALGVGFVASAVAASGAAAGTTTAFGTMAVAARGAGTAVLGAFGGPVGIAITAVALAVGGFAIKTMEAKAASEELNRRHAELVRQMDGTKTAANSAAGGVAGVGTDALGSIPKITAFGGKVGAAAQQLYNMARAAKAARVEMLQTQLTTAQSAEVEAGKRTSAGRSGVRADNRAAVARGDLLAVDFSPLVGSVNNVLSGGRTDREADRDYATAVDTSRRLQRQLRDAQRAPISASDVHTPTASGADTGTGKKKGGGVSDAQRDYQQAVEGSKTYAEQLKVETDNIGKNAVEQRLADAAREAAKAPTAALRREIMDSANAWASATIAQQVSEAATKALNEQLEEQARKQREAMAAGASAAEQVEFDTRLIGMNAQQRAVAIATRDLERQGIVAGTLAYDLYSGAVLNAAAAQGQLHLDADNAHTFADAMGAVNDNVRAATDSFGELFGTAGQGFAGLVASVADYADKTASIEARLADERARYGEGSIEAKRAEAAAASDLANAEMAHYGDMIRSAKGFFKEKSAAYKVMEGVEKAYAAVRLALAVKDMLTEGLLTTTKVAGAGTRMAVDGAETASSVAKSGIRAAADGVAAFAKTLASLPFPLNLAAGAAVLAALVSVGVKVAGGGKKSGSADAESATTTAGTAYTGPQDEYGNPTSGYSVLKTGRTTVAGNDNTAPNVGMAGAAGGGNVTNANTYSIRIDGNADERTVQQLQEVLANHEDRVVERSRAAAAQDRATAAGRQRIGGG